MRQRIGYLSMLLAGGLLSLLDAIGVGLVALLASGFASETAQPLGLPGFMITFVDAPLWVAVTIITAIFAGKSVLYVVYLWQLATFLAKAEGDVAERIAQSVLDGDLTRFRSASRAEIEWALVRSTTVAIQGVLGHAGIISTSAVSALFVVAVMIVSSPVLALVMLTSISCVLAGTHFFLRAKISKLGGTISQQTVALGSTISGVVSSYRELAVYRQLRPIVQTISQSRRGLASAYAHMGFFGQLPRIILEFSLILVIAGYAALLLRSPDLTQALAIFPLLAVGGFRILGALLPLQRAVSALAFESPQAEQAQGFAGAQFGSKAEPADCRDEISKSSRLQSAFGQPGVSINLRGVSFSYTDREVPVAALSNVSADVSPGEILAIVGASGAGKSTLANLVLGLESPTTGRITLDSISPEEYAQQYPGSLAFVPRSPGTIPGSLRDNITLQIDGGPVASTRLQDAIVRSGLASVADSLPNGLDTDMGKFSDSLSSGQMQMLGLARALYRAPRLLVLDEATNSLDVTHQAKVLEVVGGLRGEVTVLLIAHSSAVVQLADRVILLEGGAITAAGRPKDVENASEKARILLNPAL